MNTDELKIDTTGIMVVEIEEYTFEVDERFPWVNVYKRLDDKWGNRSFVTEINGDDTPIFVNSEEGYEALIKYCKDWYLNHVGA